MGHLNSHFLLNQWTGGLSGGLAEEGVEGKMVLTVSFLSAPTLGTPSWGSGTGQERACFPSHSFLSQPAEKGVRPSGHLGFQVQGSP